MKRRGEGGGEEGKKYEEILWGEEGELEDDQNSDGRANS